MTRSGVAADVQGGPWCRSAWARCGPRCPASGAGGAGERSSDRGDPCRRRRSLAGKIGVAVWRPGAGEGAGVEGRGCHRPGPPAHR